MSHVSSYNATCQYMIQALLLIVLASKELVKFLDGNIMQRKRKGNEASDAGCKSWVKVVYS